VKGQSERGCAVLQIVADQSLPSVRAPLLQGGPVSAITDEQSWRLWQIVAFHLAAAAAAAEVRCDAIMRDGPHHASMLIDAVTNGDPREQSATRRLKMSTPADAPHDRGSTLSIYTSARRNSNHPITSMMTFTLNVGGHTKTKFLGVGQIPLPPPLPYPTLYFFILLLTFPAPSLPFP